MSKAHFGMVGLGTMGRNFLLNIAEHGISAAGYDLDASKRDLLLQEGAGMPLTVGESLADFVSKLESPRNLMLLVPAGPIVDSVLAELVPVLEAGNLVIDGGNSHFSDTERRGARLAEAGIEFLGVGVSGGEEGARRGASIMAGGDPVVYARVQAAFESVSAKVDGEPCAAHVGLRSAGHFVKMVHNGIEYGMMQMIAETYDILRRLNRLEAARISEVFAEWDAGDLDSYLIEITAAVLRKVDLETGRSLTDLILDTAGQKGTGKWTSQSAMDLGIPVPTIDSAVTMRQLSALKAQRAAASQLLSFASSRGTAEEISTDVLGAALHLGFISAYAQGFALLSAAGDEHSYEIDLAEVTRIWRGGCIIRSRLLNDLKTAFESEPRLANILIAENFRSVIEREFGALQQVAETAVRNGIPCLSLSASLNYITAYATERLPANLIQAQRDYFGAHTYQRIDKEGIFHTEDWDERA